MKRYNIIAALILICIIIATSRSVAAWTTIATPREVYEIGAALVEIDEGVALLHDINGNLWEVEGLEPDCPERDYYQLVIDNMGTSFPEDDVILNWSED